MTRPRFQFRPVCAAVLSGLFAAAAPAIASTIVYQCGNDVCAIDPDHPATTQRTVKTNATAAGITADGSKAGVMLDNPWGIFLVSLSDGTTTPLFVGEVYDLPRISPSGTKASWTWYFAGYGWYTYVGPVGGSGYPPAIASSTYQTLNGWLGEQPIISRRGGSSYLASICIEVSGGPACDIEVATDPTLQIGAPSGSVDGQWIVAVRGPAPTTYGVPVSGNLGLYSATTHTWVRDLTVNADDAWPVFSPDATRIAFVRGGYIRLLDVAPGASSVQLVAGTTPYWGGGGGTDVVFRNGFE